LMSLSSEENWNRYKKVVGQANVSCLEVVVDITRGPNGNVNMNEEVPLEVQNGTQESTILEDDLVLGNLVGSLGCWTMVFQ
jgi:hypothetical protein